MPGEPDGSNPGILMLYLFRLAMDHDGAAADGLRVIVNRYAMIPGDRCGGGVGRCQCGAKSQG